VKLKIRNPKHLPARSRFAEGRQNPKQYPMTKIQMTEAVGGRTFVLNIGVLKF
jgi:hypothetical protein